MATFDQLNILDIAGADTMVRVIQFSEERYRDRMPTSAGGSGDPFQDAFFFTWGSSMRVGMRQCVQLCN
eukprot:6216010-Pyramimonas_sp.AAC.1